MSQLRRRLTYANVMATIAVFIALGGASYAALKLPKNSVGTKQIKKNAVTTAKIKNQAVNPAKLADGAVTAAKLAPGVAISGPQGPQGPPGVPPPVEATKVITSFLDGWEAFDAGGNEEAPVRYWKDLSGTVHLEGAVANAGAPADGSGIFRLPEGYRPEANYLSFAVVTTGSSDFNEVLGFVQIVGEATPGSSGGVTYWGGNPEYVSLDGIEFRAK